jgi:hypothetical protein
MSIGGGSVGRKNATGRIEAFSDGVFAITLLIIPSRISSSVATSSALCPFISSHSDPSGGVSYTYLLRAR